MVAGPSSATRKVVGQRICMPRVAEMAHAKFDRVCLLKAFGSFMGTFKGGSPLDAAVTYRTR